MALVRERVLSSDGGLIYIDLGYDDVTLVVSRVYWANLTPDLRATARITLQNGTKIIEYTCPPNTAEQSKNLNPNQRWSFGSAASPTCNLSSAPV